MVMTKRTIVQIGKEVFIYIKGKDTFTSIELRNELSIVSKEESTLSRLLCTLVDYGYLVSVKQGVSVRYYKYE